MKAYKPLEEKNANGKFYEEYDIPEGLPIDHNLLVAYPPDLTLKFPKYNWMRGLWEEDKDSIIEEQIKENKALKERLSMNEASIIELTNMVLGGE